MQDKKIVFFAFQGFSKKNHAEGMVKFLTPLVDYFYKNLSKNIIFYVREKKTKCNRFTKQLNKIYPHQKKIHFFINKYILKQPIYKLRLFEEKLYDLYASYKINKSKILISSSYLLRTTIRNKNKGGINIFIAGNPYDKEIYELLLEEQKSCNVIIKDAYTYKRRIDFIVKSLKSYDHICCFTKSEYDSFIKFFPKTKVSFLESHIIPNFSQFKNEKVEKEAEFTFCFISHPFWLKGLPYLLEAWKIANLKNCKLRIGGRLDQQLQHYINENYSDLENIEYTGWVKDLNSFYRSSNVCIVPSLLDAGPTTVTEAMYCKLPVIVTSFCGSHTLVNNHKNGFVISSKNTQEISDKMIWFSENRNLAKQMGEDANKAISNLSDDNKQKELSDFLIKIIDKTMNL